MKKLLAAVVALLALAPSSASAQERLAAARELYAAAAYEDALDLLNKMRAPGGPEIAPTDAEVLKVFCLLALHRDDDARSVIETVIIERPTYIPAEDETSPRIRAAFRDVRRKLLPSLTRQLYASARVDYDNKNVVAAAAKFSDLLKVLADPDLAQDTTLADLRVLAEGFRVLSAAAADVATAADTQLRSNPAITNRPADSSAAASPAPATPPIAALLQLPVTPPVPINQQMPPWHRDPMTTRAEFIGVIDVLIDERGHVESASLRKSIHPRYDSLLLEAARAWTYEPATRGGQPIKFQKTVVVRLNNR